MKRMSAIILSMVMCLLASACATPQGLRDPVACLGPGGETLPSPEVWPLVNNQAEVRTALQREYSSDMRQRGLMGRAEVCALIDVAGMVGSTRVEKSSGIEEIDRAAIAVVSAMQFDPGTIEGRPVRVAVVIPVAFSFR